jgi:hypothetical protein
MMQHRFQAQAAQEGYTPIRINLISCAKSRIVGIRSLILMISSETPCAKPRK